MFKRWWKAVSRKGEVKDIGETANAQILKI